LEQIVYTIKKPRKDAERLQITLLDHQDEIFNLLGLFPIPWEKEFYGIQEIEYKVQLKFDGTIFVSGPNKDKCNEIITFIISVLCEKIFKERIDFGDPILEKVELNQDVTSSIDKMVPIDIKNIVEEKISPDLNIKDISYIFQSKDESNNLNIKFEKTKYFQGEESVPFKVIIITNTENACRQIIDELKVRLSLEIIEE